MPATPNRIGVFAVLWLAGLYLRLPMLVAPPLAPLIGVELDLNQSQIGALTTIPVLMLALGALPGSFFIARLGARRALSLALVVLALASAGRGLAPPTVLLFAFTVLLGFAVAVMQPALPVLVGHWCRGSLAFGSAVYMNGMLMGEFIGAGLTLPIVLPLLDGDWRAALVVWSLPALVVAALVQLWDRSSIGDGARSTSADRDPDMAARTAPLDSPGGSAVVAAAVVPGRSAWPLGIMLGAASAGFFGTNAYMGTVLAETGQSSLLPQALFWFNATQVAGSLLMLALGRHLLGRRWPVIAAAAGVLLGLIGFGLGGHLVALTAVLVLGLCTCIQLILMVSLVPQMASGNAAARLGAGMFTVGYLLGFLVPQAGGLLADASGLARAALLPMIVLAAAALLVAVLSRFGHR
jgi:MFS transporter, CP family, cyanate transporter